MSAKLSEVVFKRLFENIFVCLKCKRKMRAHPQKIRQGKICCRYCGYDKFRTKSKEGKR
jgi:DNA-directed RNA polymerase subunit RPC12/RpoP